MKRAVLGAVMATFAFSPAFGGETFENFCIATAQDSPDACECGQVLADTLLSLPEQEALVRILSGETAEEELAEAGVSREVFENRTDAWDQSMVKQCYS